MKANTQACWSSEKPLKKVKWSVAWNASGTDLCKADEVTVKNGKVSLAKNFTVTVEKSLYVIAEADDYAGNASRTARGVFGVVLRGTADEPASMKFVDWSGNDLGSAFVYDFAPIYVRIYDKNGLELNYNHFTFASSNKKAIVCDRNDLKVLQVTGKPVTITATAKDGSRKKISAKITLQKKDAAKIGLYAETWETEDGVTLKGETLKGEYEAAFNNEMLYIELFDAENNDRYSVLNNTSLKVTGGIDVTAKVAQISGNDDPYDGKNHFYVVPTAAETVIKVKSGKTTTDFTLVNKNYASEKLLNDLAVNVQKIWSDQELKILVGKQYAGKTVRIADDYTTIFANKSVHMTAYEMQWRYAHYGSISGFHNYFVVDEEGYITPQVYAGNYSKYDGVKVASSFKAKLFLMNDDKAVTAPVTVTFKFVKAPKVKAAKAEKNDFQLKKSYTISKTQVNDNGSLREITGAEITYNGKKSPKATLRYVSNLKSCGLAESRLKGDAWTEAVKLVSIAHSDGTIQRYIALTDVGVEKLRAMNGGKPGKVSTDMYITYGVKTPDGSPYNNITEKIKVTFDIPAATAGE